MRQGLILIAFIAGCSNYDAKAELEKNHQKLLEQCDDYSGDSWCHYTEWESIGEYKIKVKLGRWEECKSRVGREGASGLVGLATVESCVVVGQSWQSGCESYSLICEEYKP